MPATEVVVTGIGLATPLGQDMPEFTRRLFGSGAQIERVSTRFAAAIPGARFVGDPGATLSRTERSISDRSVCLALLAGERALSDAGWQAGDAGLRGCGVFVGSSCGPAESVSQSYARLHDSGRVHGLTLLRCLPGGAAAGLAIRHRLQGPNQTFTSACASSTIALGEAMRAIRHGYVDVALAGGAEAPFADGTIKAWEALGLLAPAGDDPNLACRPFDASRQGLVLAESSAFFVLESAEHAAARGARALASLAGYASAGDAHHWTEPGGTGQVIAMRQALRDAGISPAEVHGINAYGPGTRRGDAVEAASIAEVFGAGPAAPWVHSTKSLHGHALGASGAVELAAVIACLQEGRLPPTRNLARPDDLPVNLVCGHPRELPADAVLMSNSFAFGGSNACLVVRPGAAADAGARGMSGSGERLRGTDKRRCFA